ncbi:MAG: hypothetical protein ACRC2T_04005 [Thermoguttaceae bacterium]
MFSNISVNDATLGFRSQQIKQKAENTTPQISSGENQSQRPVASSQILDEYISSTSQSVATGNGVISQAVKSIGAKVSRLAGEYNRAKEFGTSISLRIDSSGKFTTESSCFIKTLSNGKGGTEYQYDNRSMPEIIAKLNEDSADGINLSESVLSQFANLFKIDVEKAKSNQNFSFDIQFSNAHEGDKPAELTIASMLVGDELFLFDAETGKVVTTNLSSGTTKFANNGDNNKKSKQSNINPRLSDTASQMLEFSVFRHAPISNRPDAL